MTLPTASYACEMFASKRGTSRLGTVGEGLLPWGWATDHLAASRRYWLSTARPDGAPHAMAAWGIWDTDGMVLSAGGRSREARNLDTDRRCVVTTEDASEAVLRVRARVVFAVCEDEARFTTTPTRWGLTAESDAQACAADHRSHAAARRTE